MFKSKSFGTIMAATVTLMPPTTQAKDSKTQTKKPTKGECHGVNECKGKGECGGPNWDCAGNNSCKGQGWITKTSDECKKLGGKFKADH